MMDIKLESEWLPDGEDQWGHRVNAEVYRVENVDPVIAELQAKLNSWKAAAETFEDFYRKTEVEREGLNSELKKFQDGYTQLWQERDGLKAELKAMRERYQKDLVLSRERWCYGNRADAKIIELQSELTKARERNQKLESVLSECRYNFQHNKTQTQLISIIDALFAQQSAPAAKDLTNQSPNQCDGCQAGIPVELNQYGSRLHRMGCEGKYPDYMACTAKLYAED